MSRTRQREERRGVRNYLGPNGSDLPTIRNLMRSVAHMQTLVELATGGRYRLAVIRQNAIDGTDEDETDAVAAYRTMEADGGR